MKKNNITALILVVIVLVLSNLACATVLEPLAEVVEPNQPAPTSVPVLPTQQPEQNPPEGGAQPTQAVPSIEGNPQPTEAVPTAENNPQPVTPGLEIPANLENTFAPYWEIWRIIHRSYVTQPLDDRALMLGAIGGMQGITETVGMEMPALTMESSQLNEYALAAGTPEELVELFLPFWQTWITLETPKDVELTRAAIRGTLNALGDPYTSYMDPDDFFQANSRLEGDYEGIGAWVDPNGEYLTIISPMPGSPAEKAGLQPGDEILKIDGEDMTGIDGNLVIRRVLGPAGSEVLLSIRREGESELLDIRITRGRIIIPSVDGRMLEENIAYIQLFQFADKTRDDMRQYLTDLLAQNPKGLILDLRNNGGGYLNTAIEVASEFIGSGDILYEVYGDGRRDTFTAIRGGVALEIPLIVLVNGGSASASEIVAGAIQDYERGLLVGTTTFGKGSVQNWVPLSSEDGAVRVTIAYWYTPDNRLIHETGLVPDVVVEFTEEDMEAERDPQLEKAIELLLQNP